MLWTFEMLVALEENIKGCPKLLSSNCLFRISLFKRFGKFSNPQKKVKVKPTKKVKVKLLSSNFHFRIALFKRCLLLSNPHKKVKVKPTKECETHKRKGQWNSCNQSESETHKRKWKWKPQNKVKAKLLSSNCLFRISLFKRFFAFIKPTKESESEIHKRKWKWNPQQKVKLTK